MYEKTIAADQRIYQVTVSATKTKIVDLLSASDLEDYKAFLEGTKAEDPNTNPAKSYKRVVVDGYVLSPSSTLFFSTLPDTNTAEEQVEAGIQFTNPVKNWPEKLWVRGSGTAIIRVFFS